MQYVKLFSNIIHSTIWREDNATRLIWITLLAMADYDGCIEASIPGLADAARVSVGECEAALLKLKSPDPYSRSPEHEGRRVASIEGGWAILNHQKYREKKSPRTDYRREYMRDYRTKNDVNSDVNTCKQMLTHTDTDTDTDKKKRVVNKFTPPSLEEVESYCQEIDYTELDASSFLDFYESKGWMVGKNKMKDWRAAVRTWKRRQKPDLIGQATGPIDEDDLDRRLGVGK